MRTRALGVMGLALLGAALCLAAPRAVDRLLTVVAVAQAPPVPAAPDPRFAGLQWGFVRIHYTAWTFPPRRGVSPYDEPWYIDAPAAEWNLSRRVRTATAIQVNDPIEMKIEDPELFNHPWIYIVEGGNLRLNEREVPILREYLLRGGTLTFDDFHGPYEWDLLVKQLKIGCSFGRSTKRRSGNTRFISDSRLAHSIGPWKSSNVSVPPRSRYSRRIGTSLSLKRRLPGSTM